MNAGNFELGGSQAGNARTEPSEFDNYQIEMWVILGCLILALVWCYWNTLTGVARHWDNPKYSHGWMVPAFTAVLIWMRREAFGKATQSARWAGVGLIALGLLMRLAATRLSSTVPEMYSLIPCVMGAFMVVGGWVTLRWAGPAVLFLVLMFPLPGPLDGGLLAPMQKMATVASTYCLQTLGIAAYSEGNRIDIGELQMGVVEACSGLRMLTMFVALGFAIVLITDRPMWERAVIVVSTVFIALLVNIIRITVTGILHLTVGTQIADKVFHDLAGWVMMPMALGFLYLEFQILSHLVIEDGPSGPVKIGVPAHAAAIRPDAKHSPKPVG